MKERQFLHQSYRWVARNGMLGRWMLLVPSDAGENCIYADCSLYNLMAPLREPGIVNITGVESEEVMKEMYPYQGQSMSRKERPPGLHT